MTLASCTHDGCGGGATAVATEVSGAAAGDLTSFEERAGGEGSLGSLDPPLHPPHHFFLARLALETAEGPALLSAERGPQPWLWPAGQQLQAVPLASQSEAVS